MFHSPFLSKVHWPVAFFPQTLFHYFTKTKYSIKDGEDVDFNERHELLEALNSNAEFSKFWSVVQHQYPRKQDYLLSLTDENEPFDPLWIKSEYNLHLQRSAFDSLSEQERGTLQDEFIEMRPAAYRAALNGEASRLCCDVSDVLPRCPVLPLISDNDEESMLTKLPDDIFRRVFISLNTLEIFRVTLVCRKWRSLIYNNRGHLNRAEHSVTSHIITFTAWMDPSKTPPGSTFLREYQLYSWFLARWYCGLSENLETLILDHPIPYVYLTSLLQSCPNLKHLRIADDRDLNACTIDKAVPLEVRLSKLEVFISSGNYSVFWDYHLPLCRPLYLEILISSDCLRVFKGPIEMEHLSLIKARRPLSIALGALIVLDLELFTAAAIEVLASIENLQLKYLRLGVHECSSELDGEYDEERTRDAFHQVLLKVDKLEMLRTSTYVGVTNDTIMLLTDLELNLSFAVLYHAYCPPETEEEEWEPTVEVDPIQPDVLLDFRDMLLSKNPSIDLSKIQFVLVEGETLDSLEALDTGFTFLRLYEDDFEACLSPELHDPEIKRYLGIDF